MSTKQILENLRTRLLDLTLRNRLLSFRYAPKSVVRVVDEIPSILFTKLLSSSELTFAPVPEPELEEYVIEVDTKEPKESDQISKFENGERKVRPPVKEYAEKIGINVSYELSPRENGKTKSNHQDSKIQTLLYPDELEKAMSRVFGLYKTAIEETGNNLLYLTFGCLEYLESDDSEEPRRAPLVLLPVSLKREAPPKGNPFYQFTISASGEEPSVNLTLIEKLKREYGINIPIAKFEAEDEEQSELSLDSYFLLVKELLQKSKPKWKIINDVNLCTLNFGKLVLYKDLQPENWASSEGRIDNHPLVNSICNGQEESEPKEASLFAKDYHLDDLPIENVPALIYDADSSQHSALIDALAGKNLVIEGPPGTGKSQTITNLIAAALGQGKKVLFVAEKLAALEVVKKRLDAAGLGDFCLELHSTKIQKKSVLGSIKKRLDGTYPKPREIQIQRRKLEEHKLKINDYVKAILTTLKGFTKTYSESVGRYTLLKAELESAGVSLAEFLDLSLTLAEDFDEIKLDREIEKIRLHFSFLENIRSTYGSLERHPWHIASNEEVTSISIDGRLSNIEKLQDILISMATLLDNAKPCPIPRLSKYSFSNIQLLSEILSSTQGIASGLKPNLVNISLSLEISKISELLDIAKSIRMNENALSVSNCIGLVEFDLSTSDFEEISAVLSKLETFFPKTIFECRSLHSSLKESQLNILEITTQLQSFCTQFGLPKPNTFHDLLLLCHIIDKLVSLSKYEKELLKIGLSNLENSENYGSAKQKATQAINLKQDIEEEFNEFAFEETSSTLRYNTEILKSANWFTSLFNSQHRLAREWLKKITINPLKAKYSVLSIQLHKLYGFKKNIEDLERLQNSSGLLGKFYKGIETNFSAIDKAIAELSQFRDIISEYTNNNPILTEFIEKLDSVSLDTILNFKTGSKLSFLVASTETSLKRDLGIEFTSMPIEELVGTVDKLQKAVSALVAKPYLSKCESVKLLNLSHIIECSVEYSTKKKILSPTIPLLRELGFEISDIKELEKQISAVLIYQEKMSEYKSDKDGKVNVFGSDFFSFLIENDHFIKSISKLGIEVLASVHSTGISAQRVKDLTPLDLSEKIEFALSHKDLLQEWDNITRLRGAITGGPFKEVLPSLEAYQVTALTASMIAEMVFLRNLVHKHHQQSDLLNFFDGLTHDDLRARYAEIDRNLMKQTRAEIASQLGSVTIPSGNSSGSKSTWTGLSLIKRELEKAQRHIPIRQLMARAGDSVQSLKPCFMMSPISVAQFLPPGKIEFDLIVMDEASQLRPEDAIGAIARGRQVVVVGDTKQLPPTAFFDSGEDPLNESEIESFESILEQSAGIFRPARRLKWHYRSQHESLIAFSNSQFYDNELILFPTPNVGHSDYGVKFRYISNGVYEGSGRNLIEAQNLVDSIKNHARQFPLQSLGVVTMNSAQKEIIEDLLLNESKSDPVLAEFITNGEEKRDKFFVKNLENVQGDERDVIFISVTYGRDSSGSFHHRFGPINQKNGYRRLNVLFSRSKIRMEVFCSFEPELLSGANSIGAQALKGFLEFAKTGKLPTQITVSGKSFDSPFEQAVAKSLEKLGYKVVPQVGVAGYFIDLGIVNPSNPGQYILGVECDGAAYHSSKCARDRDRLRQQNLENLGWSIHRIWSSDWFKNEKREIARLKLKIDSIISGVKQELPKIHAVTPQVSSTLKLDKDGLRKLLIEFRENIIKKQTPDIPSELGILRKTLLEAIVEAAPTSRSDFDSLISKNNLKYAPEHQDYIPRILEIIKTSKSTTGNSGG